MVLILTSDEEDCPTTASNLVESSSTSSPSMKSRLILTFIDAIFTAELDSSAAEARSVNAFELHEWLNDSMSDRRSNASVAVSRGASAAPIVASLID